MWLISGSQTEVKAAPSAFRPPYQTSPKNHEIPIAAQGKAMNFDWISV